MTDEVADWTGNGRRLRSRTSTVNDSTGSTIMIIIVGPMIGSSSVPLLMLLLIVAMIARSSALLTTCVIGSGAYWVSKRRLAIHLVEILRVSGSAGLDEQRRGVGDELLREHAELLGFER